MIIINDNIFCFIRGISMSKKKMSLTSKVLIGLLLGLIAGIIVYSLPSGILKDTILINGIFQLLGQIFLRGIMMLVCALSLYFLS